MRRRGEKGRRCACPAESAHPVDMVEIAGGSGSVCLPTVIHGPVTLVVGSEPREHSERARDTRVHVASAPPPTARGRHASQSTRERATDSRHLERLTRQSDPRAPTVLRANRFQPHRFSIQKYSRIVAVFT